MCDCLEKQIEILREKLTEQHHGLLQVGQGAFKDVHLDKETLQPVLYLPFHFLTVNIESQELQKYDDFYKTKYCPFCGEEYLYSKKGW